MRHKIIITKFLSLVICTSVNAQSAIDNVLAEINKNNKTILATAQYYQAQNLEFKTAKNFILQILRNDETKRLAFIKQLIK